jgi:type IX secretion system PorP/SprF family membrane protein
MKKISLAIILCVSVFFAKAQQIGMYSHYFFKPMVYNPAFTGYEGDVNAMIVNRSQWTEFHGAPQLNLFTLDGRISNKKVGLGLNLISDRKGIINRVGGNFSYSYRLSINDNTHIMFGVAAGVIDQSINYSKALVEDASDPFLFGDVQRKTSFDANAGLAFIWKELEFGFGVPQLAANKINYVDNENTRAYYSHARHYIGSLKYKFFISKEKGISVIPQGLVRFVPNTPFQYDGTLLLDWKDKFWFGATYKSDYAVAINAGVCLHKQFYIGYSYDFIIGSIGQYSGMSHELMINFKFGKNKKDEDAIKEAVAKMTAKNDSTAKRLDSLQNELSMNQEKLKEDQRRIKENQDKINELNNKLEQQSKLIEQANANIIAQNQNNAAQNQGSATEQNNNANNQVQPSVSQQQGNGNTGEIQNKNTGNQNSAAVASNANKVMESGVWLVTAKTKDFKDQNENIPQKGYYVISGTFFYRDFAMNEVKRLKNQGYKSANFVYFEPKQFNYVYISKEATKEAAIKKVNELKAAGIKDAWIQMLVE